MKYIFPIILVLVLLAGCQAQSTEPSSPTLSEEVTALTPIRLPVGFIPNVQFAPLYVAIEKGFFKEQGLDVTLDYSAEIDNVALVGAGELPFTIASGEQVLLGRGSGLPLVYTLAWYQDYPVGVVSLQDAGITSPQDLRGKRIGIPMLSGASYIGLTALLSSAGLTEQDVSLDVIGFTQLESLVSGRDDAVVVYAANEPVQLHAKGYATNLLRTSDYSNLVGNGLVTSEMLRSSRTPSWFRKMTTAILQGIMFATDNPDEAYEISRKFVENLDENDPVQKTVLAKSIEMWKSAKPGWSNPNAWENMQNVLLGMGLLSEPSGSLRSLYQRILAGKIMEILADAVLEVRNLGVSFQDEKGELETLQEASFALAPQEFVCLIGPSGSGKTTLLRVLAGLLTPSTGEVIFHGDHPPRIGLVFQQANLMPWRSALANITLPLEMEGVPMEEARRRAQEWIAITGLEGFENAWPRDLSGGMAQRVAIARALIQSPDLLLLDEPFGSLDALTRESMGAELLRIWQHERTTVLMVTHSISEALLLSDRVLVFSPRPGRIRTEMMVDLPRPRTEDIRYSPQFMDLARSLRAAITRGD